MFDKDTDLVFEDWKMTKDRIKHFDDIVIRLRIGGIPIASAIIGAGLASFQYTSAIIFPMGSLTISATSIVILLGAFYLLPIFALDMFHFRLLLISVRHARQIEQQEKYKGKLQITTKLTSPALTVSHSVVAICIYVFVFIVALWLAYAVNFIPIK
jgi:hypothetical protein